MEGCKHPVLLWVALRKDGAGGSSARVVHVVLA